MMVAWAGARPVRRTKRKSEKSKFWKLSVAKGSEQIRVVSEEGRGAVRARF
jgi:hypothetical protein